MRKHLAALLCAVTSTVSLAQKSPKVSAQVLVGVHVLVAANNTAAATSYRLTYSTNASIPIASPMWDNWEPVPQASSPTNAESPNVVEAITPGQIYYILFSCGAVYNADFQFNVPPGYSIHLGSTATGGFLPSTSICSPNYGGGTGNFVVPFYVLPSDGAAWLSPGFSTAPHVSDVTWAISAGTLACGASAGSIRWQSTSVTEALLSTASLIYSAPLSTVNAASSSYLSNGPTTGTPPAYYYPLGIPDQIATYYDASGNLVYLGTDQVQMYVAPNSGGAPGYTVKVFQAGVGFNWASNNPALGWSFASACTAQYAVTDPDYPGDSAAWGGRVQITKMDTASGNVDQWTLKVSGSTPITTTLIETTSLTPLRVITLVSTAISGGRTEVYKVADGSGTVSFLENRTYQSFPWNEELVSKVDDPSGLALTTTYTYYSPSSTPAASYGDGHYSKLQSVTNPEGSWVLYDYLDDFAHWGGGTKYGVLSLAGCSDALFLGDFDKLQGHDLWIRVASLRRVSYVCATHECVSDLECWDSDKD